MKGTTLVDMQKRYFLEIAYDGTDYHGWQVQHNAVSVQEVLNKALATVFRQEIETVGAGRTDAGVHASQLYVHFDVADAAVEYDLPLIRRRLNSLLPQDIAVHRIFAVADDAHTRFDAVLRSYEYHIHFEKSPYLYRFSYLMRERPNVEAMNQACQYLLGTKDFGCFSKSHTQVHTNICTIERAEWILVGDKLTFYISANRFLRNMVRAIVGTLLKIGTKGLPADHMEEVIRSQNRSNAGTSVPACGLFLTEVKYPYINYNIEQ